MDLETRSKLDLLKQQREKRRSLYMAMREDSETDTDREDTSQKLNRKNTSESLFTALYSGSQDSTSPNRG